MSMTRIGILGASSQTGSSVAFFLRKFPDMEVTCFIRSSYSKVFFEFTGISYQYIDTNDKADLLQKLGAIDVVLDFGYPTGQLHEILDRSKGNIRKVLEVMKKGSLYFYMSSIMAYGMPENEKWINHYRLPRTSYSYIKRSIEKFTFSSGKKAGIKVYNFRLGQVHGFLQSVNGSFRKKLSDTDIALVDGKADDPANIIFIYPLCEAIVQCIQGRHPAGLYTLVASPNWKLKELYDYYIHYYDLPAHVEYFPKETKKEKGGLVQRGLSLAKPYRSLLETYVLMQFPGLAVRLKGGFRRQELLQQRASVISRLDYIDYNLLGIPSVASIPGLATTPGEVLKMEKEMEESYNALIFANYK
jgi:nucleoside-diphosphate-sugar epimerase